MVVRILGVIVILTGLLRLAYVHAQPGNQIVSALVCGVTLAVGIRMVGHTV